MSVAINLYLYRLTEILEDMLYPIGIQNFEKIHKLATTGTYYFLSRPRRFGKSVQ